MSKVFIMFICNYFIIFTSSLSCQSIKISLVNFTPVKMFEKNFNGQVILCLKDNIYRTDTDLLFNTILCLI